MAKRKRDAGSPKPVTTNGEPSASKISKTDGHVDVKTTIATIQIVAGSYERVLHGVTAAIHTTSPYKPSPHVEFADTFLFQAHASAVRCLALSPLPETQSAETQGVFLATGGSDEKINVYSLSPAPLHDKESLPLLPSLSDHAISENPRNRELGTLLHHSSNITALYFPTRSKLLSSAEDNTIAVTRLKDLSVVSTVKAPRPKVQGQPSGDTAPPGMTAAGINDFAVHPSLKLMISVGRGEKCMRLWNLVTGKKAGVLNFTRDILQSVREGKYSSGEGRRIRWSPDGNEFAVLFERGAVVFGEDSRARCVAVPQPPTKLHQMSYLSLPSVSPDQSSILAVSTEDGRILFYDTSSKQDTADNSVLEAKMIAQLGGKAANIRSRIKDFEILSIASETAQTPSWVVVTGGSDGSIHVFQISVEEFLGGPESESKGPVILREAIGTCETGNRITCLKAFVMMPAAEVEDGGEDEEFAGFDGSSTSGSDGDD